MELLQSLFTRRDKKIQKNENIFGRELTAVNLLKYSDSNLNNSCFGIFDIVT